MGAHPHFTVDKRTRAVPMPTVLFVVPKHQIPQPIRRAVRAPRSIDQLNIQARHGPGVLRKRGIQRHWKKVDQRHERVESLLVGVELTFERLNLVLLGHEKGGQTFQHLRQRKGVQALRLGRHIEAILIAKVQEETNEVLRGDGSGRIHIRVVGELHRTRVCRHLLRHKEGGSLPQGPRQSHDHQESKEHQKTNGGVNMHAKWMGEGVDYVQDNAVWTEGR